MPKWPPKPSMCAQRRSPSQPLGAAERPAGVDQPADVRVRVGVVVHCGRGEPLGHVAGALGGLGRVLGQVGDDGPVASRRHRRVAAAAGRRAARPSRSASSGRGRCAAPSRSRSGPPRARIASTRSPSPTPAGGMIRSRSAGSTPSSRSSACRCTTPRRWNSATLAYDSRTAVPRSRATRASSAAQTDDGPPPQLADVRVPHDLRVMVVAVQAQRQPEHGLVLVVMPEAPQVDPVRARRRLPPRPARQHPPGARRSAGCAPARTTARSGSGTPPDARRPPPAHPFRRAARPRSTARCPAGTARRTAGIPTPAGRRTACRPPRPARPAARPTSATSSPVLGSARNIDGRNLTGRTHSPADTAPPSHRPKSVRPARSTNAAEACGDVNAGTSRSWPNTGSDTAGC